MKRSFSIIIALIFLFISHSFAQPGYVNIGKLQVYYNVHGKGEPLLLIHAGLQNSSMWDPQVDELQDKFKIITLDLPGHGKTKGTDTTIFVSQVVKSVLDQLGIASANVAGLSMGSVVAQEFTVAYPSMVKRLILLSAGANGYDKNIDSITRSWYPKMQEALKAKDNEKAATIFADTWAKGPYRVVGQVKKGAYQYVYNTTLETFNTQGAFNYPTLEKGEVAVKKISTIKCPVLIIDGDKDLPFINVSSFFLQKQMPQAKRVTLKGVAHMLNLEMPEKVSEIIKDFIKD